MHLKLSLFPDVFKFNVLYLEFYWKPYKILFSLLRVYYLLLIFMLLSRPIHLASLSPPACLCFCSCWNAHLLKISEIPQIVAKYLRCIKTSSALKIFRHPCLYTLLSWITQPQASLGTIIIANFTCCSSSHLTTPHVPPPINIGKNLYEPWQSQRELSTSHVSNLWEKITINRHSKIASVRMVLLE